MTKRKCTEKNETSICFYSFSDRTVKNAKSRRRMDPRDRREPEVLGSPKGEQVWGICLRGTPA